MGADQEIQSAGEGDLCDLCGLAYDAADEEHDWLGVELSRAAPDDWPAFDWLLFCSQQHASEWFLRPLPPVEPPAPLPPLTLSDRLEGALVVGGLTLMALLMGLGLLTALRFLIDVVT